jgi:predicted glycosyltransferase
MAARGGHWLIYALGGGWGHLTRAVSLARVALTQHRVRILTNSPYADRVRKALPELELIALDPSLDVATARRETIRHIEAAPPECLIVDTFPRGLGGELAGLLQSLAATKVLVHRDLNPRYVTQAGLREFVRSTYDLVLIPGQGEGSAFTDLPAAVITKPWLIVDPPAASTLGQQPRVVVCASGHACELAWYGSVVAELRALDPRVNVRCVAPTCPPGCPEECWMEHWPAADLYAAAHAVIGGAGYNTIYECAACQVPLIARPWPRKYDRQWLRARRAATNGRVTIVKTPKEAAQAALDQIRRPQPRRFVVEIQNGARDAAALISSPPATSLVQLHAPVAST